MESSMEPQNPMVTQKEKGFDFGRCAKDPNANDFPVVFDVSRPSLGRKKQKYNTFNILWYL